jgi:hypothetical protein
LLIAIAGFLALLRSVLLARYLARGRRYGYPLPLLLDVALDRRGDWPALARGTGPYEAVTAPQRQRLIGLRRYRAAAATAAVLLVVVGALLWWSGWLAPAQFPSAVATRREILLAFLPAALAAIAAVLLEQPEASLRRGHAARSRARLRGGLSPEIVTGWLAGVGQGALVAPRPAELVAARLPAALGVVIGIVLAVVLLPTLFAQFAGGNYLRGWGREAARVYLRAASRDSAADAPWPSLDRALRAAASLPDLRATPDSQAALELAALAVSGSVPPRGWTISAAQLDSIRARYPFTAPSGAYKLAWESGRLDAGLRRDLAGDTAVPALALWRRLARSAPLPPLWMYERGMAGAEGLSIDAAGVVPISWQPLVLGLARRNLSAAALAADAGRPDVALLRIRENIAAIARLNALPNANFGATAAEAALPPTLDAMRALARQRGDSALRRQADAIQTALLGVQVRRQSFAHLALMLDPVSPPGLRVVGSPWAAPAERWRLIAGAVGAACFSPRELLFGIRPERGAVLDSAARLAADIARTDEWVAVQRRRLTRLSANGVLGRFAACWW